jgi:phosphohistidine swiveling domain-containing protein
MTAPSLQRLRRCIPREEWVKGAVNYDEDLHFSTYYLRASCTAVCGSLYPGYSRIVAFYEGCNETYYLLRDECRTTSAALVERARRRPRWLPRILQAIRRRTDALADIFPPEMSPSGLARLSDVALLALYRRHDVRHRALYKVARMPEALDRGDAYFTEYLLERLKACGLSAEACAEAFAIVSQPAAPSVLAQEILDFDAIVQLARAQASAPAAPWCDSPSRMRLVLDPELLRRLEAHRDQWQYVAYHGYGRRQLTSLDQYLTRLAEQLRNPVARADGDDVWARCAHAEQARQTLFARLKLDVADRTLFALYAEIGAVKLYRRYGQLRNFHGLDLLLAEIARRLDVSEWTIRCMLPEEVVAALRSGRLARTTIQERLDGCVYVLDARQEWIAGAEQARELRRLFQPESRRGAPNVLTGSPACRGKAVGRCKIVLRADDCRDGFEKGTILVSESTDPDLVPLLRAAGGVLTEQGGVTAHAAVICRELGVPAILGVEGLLDRVHDGDWIEMDAERGVVQVIERRRPSAAAPRTAEEIGSKAYNLDRVRSLGFRVPDFVLLHHEEAQRLARRPNRRRIESVLAELGVSNGEKLALRSSAFAEDRADGSAAGVYHSLLDVGRADFAAALREFVQSNRFGRGGDAYRGAVIVQRMVHADCSGVCLTRDDRTGYGDGVILEMVEGGNRAVTGGAVRPDRVVVDRLTGDILHEERRCPELRRRALDLGRLVRDFLTLEAHFAAPLDIEWALAGGELYILQARPIVESVSG